MGKIMLTWEAGAYLGHEVKVTSAALMLKRAGHEVVVYAPHGTATNSTARRARLRWENVGAYPQEPGPSPGVPWRSRATSLWNVGFHTHSVVRDRLLAWDAILEREQPDLTLLQAAPYAQVMARLACYRSVEFGIGFDVPPNVSPFPPFRHTEDFSAQHALQLEQRIQLHIAKVFRTVPGSGRLYEMVSGDTRLVTSLPELDHYDGCGDATRQFVGPLPMLDRGTEPLQWRGSKPRVLVYVRSQLCDAASLLKALAKVRVEAIVVCMGADEATRALADKLDIRLFASPITLTELLPAADLVVSHGGGLMAEALVHGCACMALPSHYEQFMTSGTLQRRHLGVNVNPAEPRLYEPALRHVLADKEIRRHAKAMGERYRHIREHPGTEFLAAVEAAMQEAREAQEVTRR
jgi:hypothetical protein